MRQSFLTNCRFTYMRLLRIQPGAIVALTIALSVVVAAALGYLLNRQQTLVVERELGELRANSIRAPTIIRDGNADTLAGTDLPAFRSAQLVGTLNQIAVETVLPLDEVAYVLDDSASQPYLRYRMTLTVAGAYPVIRRFVAELSMTMPHVVLDAISCSRDDIAVAQPTCDLVFSAFYRKNSRG